VKDSTIAQVQRKHGNSHFWSGLLKVKESFLILADSNYATGRM
jgi:hypothetical protein